MSDSSLTDRLFPMPFSLRQGQLAFYVVIVGFIIFLLVTGTQQFSDNDMLFPYIVGIPSIIVGVVHLVSLIFPGLESKVMPERADASEDLSSELKESIDSEDQGRPLGERQRYGLMMTGWVLVLPVLVFYLGFAYILTPYVFAFIIFFRRDVKLAAFISILFTIAAYVLFILILGMIPWQGQLGLPSLINMLPF